MYSPLEMPMFEPRRSKKTTSSNWTSTTSSVMKATNRKLQYCGHFMCRLPLLILWIITVIILVYSSSNQPATIMSSSKPQWEAQTRHHSNDGPPHSTENLPSEPSTSQSPRKLLTPPTEHLRQGKVFILIVQSEQFHFDQNLNKNVLVTTVGRVMKPRLEELSHHRLVIPSQIRRLIDILDSHRIGYTIDTTRYGVPNQLIADQDHKQYPVIVVDDFLKYQKLNRWVRDQLDRHCRLNEIGVIAYLTHSDDLTFSTSTKASLNHVLFQRSTSTPTGQTETLADQFPFRIRQFNSVNCKDAHSKTCLVDYQLNEEATILRTLKRRPDFIVKGELRASLIPWVSMSTVHATYEPLTWAKSRQLRGESVGGPMDTQHHHDHRVARAALNYSKRPGDEESRQDEMDLVEIGELPNNNNDDGLPELDAREENDWHDAPSSSKESADLYSDGGERHVLSMFDKGSFDGIRRVIFGVSNEHWLNRMLALDAIEHLSMGKIITPLDRYIQIDIDDIFVGEKVIRMNQSDVENLVETQHRLASMFSDGLFKFNLGFSGNYFKHGHEEENLGDETLVARADQFTWFCHFWSHSKAHLFNDTKGISQELRKNLQFARQKRLPIIGYDHKSFFDESNSPEMGQWPTYAVAPHHSGVYPIHEQLYEAWKEVLNVQVTSTEEYPHLKPANQRRAFVHKTIKVLPRQTCGLYTHTIYRRRYPGGFGRLLASINGGDLFETILHNPVNIYMTHMSNYANDRLAPFAFLELIKFVQLNTNLQLKYAPTTAAAISSPGQPNEPSLGPMKLADYYFSLYPLEREPLWTDPCKDPRHLAIWAPAKQKQSCPVVPSLLIVGPQKTGTSALHAFLRINHLFRSSQMSPQDFEEVQFFNDKHYFKGVDWYFDRFKHEDDHHANSSTPDESLYFDKSATYFDDPKAPQRAYALLPDARIVILLLNPVDRAYSWYQHIKAHAGQEDGQIASLLSFDQIIQLDETRDSIKPDERTQDANGTTSADDLRSTTIITSTTTTTNIRLTAGQLRRARSLRDRCLQPGLYARHLMRWLEFYPSYQVIIIDSEWFKYNPAAVLNRLQLLLRVAKPIDYNQELVFDKDKGFYCQRGASPSAPSRCLGPGKGRKYPPMSRTARAYLDRFYKPANRQLARLLSEIGQPLPNWLGQSIDLMN